MIDARNGPKHTYETVEKKLDILEDSLQRIKF